MIRVVLTTMLVGTAVNHQCLLCISAKMCVPLARNCCWENMSCPACDKCLSAREMEGLALSEPDGPLSEGGAEFSKVKTVDM